MALGEPATLILLGDDYDGGKKAWVRWGDGKDDIVPGSRDRACGVAGPYTQEGGAGEDPNIEGAPHGDRGTARGKRGGEAVRDARGERGAQRGGGAGGERAPPAGDRQADRGGARDDEGRGDEAGAGDVVPGRRPRARGAPRGVPARARKAARRGAHGGVQADEAGDRGRPRREDRGRVRRVRRGADSGGVDRAGVPREATLRCDGGRRRSRGGGEGAVSGRGERGAGGHAEPRHDHAAAQADDAGARREGDRRRRSGSGSARSSTTSWRPRTSVRSRASSAATRSSRFPKW